MERYCPSKKPMWEHDKECYYHGEETTCPLCGMQTKECMEGEYIPQGTYTKEEIIDGIIGQNITNYGRPNITLYSNDHIEGYSEAITSRDRYETGES